jgi:Ca2+-binding EF-hand superfamily protein
MSVLAGGDLNCDSVLTSDELRRTKAAVSASARAKQQRSFVQADVDGDGKVSASELAAYCQLAADKAVSLTEIKTTKLVMAFDANDDGKVTVDEVREGLSF